MSSGAQYSWSSLTPTDLQAWSDLVNLLAKVDGTEEYYTPADLAEELEFAEVHPPLDTWAVRTDAGDLIAYGQVFFRDALVEGAASSSISGGVHPAHRRRGIGTELLRRIEERAGAGNAQLHHGRAAVVRADVGVQVLDARALLLRHGYVESRFFHEMRQDLSDLPSADIDDDVAAMGIRPYALGADDDTVLDVHTQAFAAHWRSAPWSVAEWRHQIVDARSFRPQLSFVHVGELGAIDGYVLSSEYVEGEVWVTMAGVLEAERRRGIGSALLRAVLRAARDGGYRDVGLGVDSDNSVGAGRLYGALGFLPVRATVACLKTLPPV